MSVCTVNISGTAQGPCTGSPCTYTGGGKGDTATCCVSSWSGCSGSNSASCGTYPSCSGSLCCAGASFSGCSGTNTGSCGTYPTCGSCCTGQQDDFCTGGSNSYTCAGNTQAQCTSAPASTCCYWTGSSCAKRTCTATLPRVYGADCGTCGCNPRSTGGTCIITPCASLGQGTCGSCGCTESGTCPKKSCTSLGQGDCAGCGCTGTSTCTPRDCAGVAAINNNPNVCAGCSSCRGTWQVTAAEGALPWSVDVVAISFNATGSIGITAVCTIAIG